jgi:ferredoxin
MQGICQLTLLGWEPVPLRFQVPEGTNLRAFLLKQGLSPYAPLTRRINCGGRGICATCGVWIHESVDPAHWHDRLAARWGYPRLSCQIFIREDMTVARVPDKWIWGGRKHRRKE